MRMRKFTPCQSPADIRITPQKYKLDPDVSLKHDDLDASAWECEYEESIFDAENNDTTPPTSFEIPIQCDVSNEEMNTPGTTHECSPDFFLKWKNYVT